MYFVCNVRKHHTFRRNTEENIYRREVQSRRRDYFTSLRILIKQSNSWESSLIHLDSRQAECEWGSSNHLESWMDTKDKGLWNQENARRGYRIYNIMPCFHKVYSITRHWHQFADGTAESAWTLALRSINSVDLYSTGANMQLPLTSIDFMITRVRLFHMLRDSNDDAKVWESTLNIKTDGKFSAKKTVQESLQIPDA